MVSKLDLGFDKRAWDISRIRMLLGKLYPSIIPEKINENPER